MFKPNKTHKTLHKLLETCVDSRRAFENAASAVDDEELTQLFSEWHEQRKQFCTQLTNLLTILEAPLLYTEFQDGSVAGFFQRAWISIATALAERDQLAIVKACQTGEAWSREVYEKSLAQDLPTKVRETIEAQFAIVVENQATLDKLRLRLDAVTAAGSPSSTTN